MAVSRVLDHVCLHFDNGRWKRRKPCQWLPRREKWFYYRRGIHLWLLHWKPYGGIWLVAERSGDERSVPHTVTPRRTREVGIKRRPSEAATGAPPPAAKATSVLLAKLPALREWLTATTYEDGSARQPGKLAIEVYGQTWSVLLRDPDAAARMNVRGEELDKTLMLVEQLLGVEEAPWERDNWLAGQLAKKGKKK